MKLMRRMAAGAAGSAIALGAMLGTAATADASAYPVGVYQPSKVNASQAQGWANLSRDCSGTVGCFNYIKIEKWGWTGNSYVNGWWANNNGWNSITADLPGGCGYYRTTTDSYNDIAGGVGVGVNVGQVWAGQRTARRCTASGTPGPPAGPTSAADDKQGLRSPSAKQRPESGPGIAVIPGRVVVSTRHRPVRL